jgi:hypothetical protein
MTKKRFGAIFTMFMVLGPQVRWLNALAGNSSEFLEPFPAHHVIGNIYFVGSKTLGVSQQATLGCFAALRGCGVVLLHGPSFSSCSITLEDANRRASSAGSETPASADFNEVARCWG